MRILQNSDSSNPSSAPNPDRLEALENIVKVALQRLQGLTERIDALEEAPKTAVPARAPEPSTVRPPFTFSPAETAALNTDTLKKGLLSKMWKYMNDEHASKAA